MYIFFKSRDELQRIEASKIVYFEADGNYSKIMLANKVHSTVCLNLGEMEKALALQLGQDDRQFLRIGKRFIVNMQYIYQINILKQYLILSDYEHFAFKICISKEALRKMKELLMPTTKEIKP